MVNKLKLAIRMTNRFSFRTIDEIVVWARKIFRSEEITFARFALKEETFLDRSARFMVYRHTHHYEIIPLDSIRTMTWHTSLDLAINKPDEQKFVPCQVLNYLTFCKNGERLDRCFETWSGTFSD